MILMDVNVLVYAHREDTADQMTNHIHLLLTPGTGESISRLFQECGRQYVGYIKAWFK